MSPGVNTHLLDIQSVSRSSLEADKAPPGIPTPIYELYGLRVRSEVHLCAPVCRDTSSEIDIQWGQSDTVSDEPATGRVLAMLSLGDGRGYSLTDTGTGYILRFNSSCEFRIAYDLRTIIVHLASGADPNIVPLLLTGNVIAFVLGLAGEHILHASAVEVGGSALAFVAGSGMGKSTLAALLCASGAAFITDDLLRLEPDGDDFRCFPGAPEIRLRPAAAALAGEFPTADTGRTADNRLAVHLDNHSDGSMPLLRAIVIPRPSRTCEVLSMERLTLPEALFWLTCYPRITGWQVSEPIRQQFQAFGRIAKSVPLYEAQIPWGPPFVPGLASALLRSVGLGDRAEVQA
jgi:hypothetical protein